MEGEEEGQEGGEEEGMAEGLVAIPNCLLLTRKRDFERLSRAFLWRSETPGTAWRNKAGLLVGTHRGPLLVWLWNWQAGFGQKQNPVSIIWRDITRPFYTPNSLHAGTAFFF